MTAPSPARTGRPDSIFGDMARRFRRAAASQPSGGFADYKTDNAGFCVDALGFTPWEGQREILDALVKHDAVTVRSGHGVGKSAVAAAAGLWFWATRGPGARVILTAPTARQVHEVLWTETRRLYLTAKRPLGGDLAQLATTGLRSRDGRQLFGVTAQDAESFQGIRAPEMLVIADESSGIPDHIFTALTGNLAGGGKLLLLGNPTKTSGYFFDSHKSDRFTRLHIPSTRSPNVQTGKIIVRGLVTADWVAERKREWGEESPMYKCRVLGEFVEAQEGRLFTAEMIAAAEQRWHDMAETGPVTIGVDPAGAGGEGDESAFAVRREKKIVRLHTRRGLTEEAHLIEVLGLIAATRTGGMPTVIVDRDGIVGAKVFAEIAAYHSKHEDAFRLIGVRGGERAKRRPREVDRVRDEMWLSLVDAFRDGLAIPEDVRLERELAAFKLEALVSGRSKVTGKDILRRELGRSPDRADAIALAAYEPGGFFEHVGDEDDFDAAGAPDLSDPYAAHDWAESTFVDPFDNYDAMKVWK